MKCKIKNSQKCYIEDTKRREGRRERLKRKTGHITKAKQKEYKNTIIDAVRHKRSEKMKRRSLKMNKDNTKNLPQINIKHKEKEIRSVMWIKEKETNEEQNEE